MTDKETDQITRILSGAGRLFSQLNPSLLKFIQNHNDVKIQFISYTISLIIEVRPLENPAGHAKGLIRYLKNKLEKERNKLKTEKARLRKEHDHRQFLKFFQENNRQLALIFDMQNMIIACKLLIMNKLQNVKTMTKTFIQDD